MALGACGRGLAAVRRYEEALSDLERACKGWEMIGRASEASRPICELLRVIGVMVATNRMPKPDGRRRLEQWTKWIDKTDIMIFPTNQFFVGMARAWAWMRVDEPNESERELEATRGRLNAAPWMQSIELRLRAQLLDVSKQPDEAKRIRKQLRRPDADESQALLSRLDEALFYDFDNLDQIMQTLLSQAERQIVSRLHRQLVADGHVGRQLCRLLAIEHPI